MEIQPNAIRVQEYTLCLRTLFEKDLDIIAAGRTDAGVHALAMTAHFDTASIENRSNGSKLDRMLPADIRVRFPPRVRPALTPLRCISRTIVQNTLQKILSERLQLRLYYEPDVEAITRLLAVCGVQRFYQLQQSAYRREDLYLQVNNARWERRGVS